MRKLFSTPSTPRTSGLPRRPGAELQPQLRASLEGLEVRDSTWDEWLACKQAQSQASTGRASASMKQ